MSRKIGLAYVPVLHAGYVRFFNQLHEQGVTDLYLMADAILMLHEELDYINRKDRLRALPQETVQLAIQNLTRFRVTLLTLEDIELLREEALEIITPQEDISTFVVDHYFPNAMVEYIPIFLRWNKENVHEDKEPETNSTVTFSELQAKIFGDVETESQKSFDWWRQVGAALVQNGEVIIVTHNEHMPEAQLPNIVGDTRALFKKGININYVTSAHAEVAAIGEAAKRGIKTEGAELYVTDFPCPYCARLIAKSGIKKVYFLKGYAVLDGDDFLKEEGVEVVKIMQ